MTHATNKEGNFWDLILLYYLADYVLILLYSAANFRYNYYL